jgi:large subunit ribosomal protein L33
LVAAGGEVFRREKRRQNSHRPAVAHRSLFMSTGFYYVTRKNSRTMTDKLVMKKYDPVAKKHVEFRESNIK